MELSPQQIQRFIDLYLKELNISITPVEAQQKAQSLLRLLDIAPPFFEFNQVDDSISKPGLS